MGKPEEFAEENNSDDKYERHGNKERGADRIERRADFEQHQKACKTRNEDREGGELKV